MRFANPVLKDARNINRVSAKCGRGRMASAVCTGLSTAAQALSNWWKQLLNTHNAEAWAEDIGMTESPTKMASHSIASAIVTAIAEKSSRKFQPPIPTGFPPERPAHD